MSIWEMPAVVDQPTVTLIRWRVLRLKAKKKLQIDLVLGWCLEDGHARMSTPIVDHNAIMRTLTTKSGRIYVLEGASDYDDDAQYILEEHFGRIAHKAVDVSTEYLDDALLTGKKIPNSANSVVILSGMESRHLLNETDVPFLPNEKLTKAIRKCK